MICTSNAEYETAMSGEVSALIFQRQSQNANVGESQTEIIKIVERAQKRHTEFKVITKYNSTYFCVEKNIPSL